MRSLPTGLLLTLLVIALPTLAPLRAAPPEFADSAAAQLHALFDRWRGRSSPKQKPQHGDQLSDPLYFHLPPHLALKGISAISAVLPPVSCHLPAIPPLAQFEESSQRTIA